MPLDQTPPRRHLSFAIAVITLTPRLCNEAPPGPAGFPSKMAGGTAQRPSPSCDASKMTPTLPITPASASPNLNFGPRLDECGSGDWSALRHTAPKRGSDGVHTPTFCNDNRRCPSSAAAPVIRARPKMLHPVKSGLGALSLATAFWGPPGQFGNARILYMKAVNFTELFKMEVHRPRCRTTLRRGSSAPRFIESAAAL
ncbi:hypothetical protein TRVL_07598 [Trypanosoma vivax]|nr:hypothetical protein TRVL_07598 [Trypanosoma vivax]